MLTTTLNVFAFIFLQKEFHRHNNHQIKRFVNETIKYEVVGHNNHDFGSILGLCAEVANLEHSTTIWLLIKTSSGYEPSQLCFVQRANG